MFALSLSLWAWAVVRFALLGSREDVQYVLPQIQQCGAISNPYMNTVSPVLDCLDCFMLDCSVLDCLDCFVLDCSVLDCFVSHDSFYSVSHVGIT